MAPSNLQGLNIVHPIPPSNPYLSDADLLSVPFPDLSAQLDLWTNLNFQSDEPLHSSRPGEAPTKKDTEAKKRGPLDDSEDDHERYNDPDDDVQRSGIAETHSHENVVMGTVLPPSAASSSSGGHPPMPNFDINALLATFGIDPFMAPPAPMPAQAPSPANTIAQLLSMHASSFRPGASQPIPSSAQPVSAQLPPQQQPQASGPASPATPTTTNKRARTNRNNSVSVPAPVVESPQPASPEDKSSGTPMNASEDKRRRNTAASARFRLKKKEREAALERKAKELEVRVSELEKECEALRRENGWLKGLVVGVTGAGAVQQQQQIQQQHQQSASPPPSDGVSGVKRHREEDA
uniref:BZIP domain-containing protein n=1 Tax=Ganoderma boninense TaxID=34458 RepID=A0A5K1JTK9_9APHY|nr:BZIP domain-containing protein [Ganoderma boninense]